MSRWIDAYNKWARPDLWDWLESKVREPGEAMNRINAFNESMLMPCAYCDFYAYCADCPLQHRRACAKFIEHTTLGQICRAFRQGSRSGFDLAIAILLKALKETAFDDSIKELPPMVESKLEDECWDSFLRPEEGD